MNREDLNSFQVTLESSKGLHRLKVSIHNVHDFNNIFKKYFCCDHLKFIPSPILPLHSFTYPSGYISYLYLAPYQDINQIEQNSNLC